MEMMLELSLVALSALSVYHQVTDLERDIKLQIKVMCAGTEAELQVRETTSDK